jgi:hypothetical protein
MFIPARFLYLGAGLCALYPAIVPLLSHIQSPRSWLTLVYWVCALLLLVAVILAPSKLRNTLAMTGSACLTAFLIYFIAELVAARLGLVQSSGRLMAFPANAFDLLRPMLDMPVMTLLLVFSLASLWVSVSSLRSGLRTQE